MAKHGPGGRTQAYNEAPSDNMDPWVTQEMVKMGFQLDQIHNELTKMTYHNVMTTYLIMKFKKSPNYSVAPSN